MVWRSLVCAVAMAVLLPLPLLARADERKLVTIVGADDPEGGAQIESEILEECIARLPPPEAVEPVVDAESVYLKSIGGDDSRHGSVRTWHASIELSYVVRQRKAVIVVANTVESSEPVIRELTGEFDRVVRFESNPENGDRWAGQGLVKQYYFSTPEGAAADVRQRAEAWLRQKRGALCGS